MPSNAKRREKRAAARRDAGAAPAKSETREQHPPRNTAPKLECRDYVRYSTRGVPHIVTKVVKGFTQSREPAVNVDRRIARLVAHAIRLDSPRQRRRQRTRLAAGITYWTARRDALLRDASTIVTDSRAVSIENLDAQAAQARKDGE